MKLLRDYSLVLLAFQVALRSLLLAQDGLPDSTFHFDGKVTTEISMAYCFSVAVQSDGKVVAAGYSNTANLDFTLIRYNTDGSLDNSFDSDGVTTTAIGTDDDIARALAIQSDGKILAAGEGRSSGNYFFAVVRYNADGTLDTTFGTGGKVTNDSGNTAEAVLVQTDGKILVAGYTDNSDFAVARYNSDGSLDTTFGINGLAVADIGNADIALSSVIQSDGKIVMAGYTRYASRDDFALVRFDSNGSLDNTFGSDGIVTTTFGSYADCHSVVLQADEKLVGVGVSDGYVALVRYNVDGIVDSTFGTNGIVTTNFDTSSAAGFSAAVQLDGKILVAGQGNTSDGTDVVVLRYSSNGSLDSTFVGGGRARYDLGGNFEEARGIAIRSDGKIVLAGKSDSRFAVLQLIGSSGPLPVELISFTGIILRNHAVLNWETASETDNYGFEIQKKQFDGWSTIGFVQGNGTTSSRREYSYKDPTAAYGLIAYRLKQIDFDGTITYNKELKVFNDFVAPALIQNYPNPFNSTTTIHYQLPLKSEVTLRIYDVLGGLIYESAKKAVDAGYHTFVWDSQASCSGTYFFQVTAGAFSITKKMLLLK